MPFCNKTFKHKLTERCSFCTDNTLADDDNIILIDRKTQTVECEGISSEKEVQTETSDLYFKQIYTSNSISTTTIYHKQCQLSSSQTQDFEEPDSDVENQKYSETISNAIISSVKSDYENVIDNQCHTRIHRKER